MFTNVTDRLAQPLILSHMNHISQSELNRDDGQYKVRLPSSLRYSSNIACHVPFNQLTPPGYTKLNQ